MPTLLQCVSPAPPIEHYINRLTGSYAAAERFGRVFLLFFPFPFLPALLLWHSNDRARTVGMGFESANPFLVRCDLPKPKSATTVRRSVKVSFAEGEFVCCCIPCSECRACQKVASHYCNHFSFIWREKTMSQWDRDRQGLGAAATVDRSATTEDAPAHSTAPPPPQVVPDDPPLARRTTSILLSGRPGDDARLQKFRSSQRSIRHGPTQESLDAQHGVLPSALPAGTAREGQAANNAPSLNVPALQINVGQPFHFYLAQVESSESAAAATLNSTTSTRGAGGVAPSVLQSGASAAPNQTNHLLALNAMMQSTTLTITASAVPQAFALGSTLVSVHGVVPRDVRHLNVMLTALSGRTVTIVMAPPVAASGVPANGANRSVQVRIPNETAFKPSRVDLWELCLVKPKTEARTHLADAASQMGASYVPMAHVLAGGDGDEHRRHRETCTSEDGHVQFGTYFVQSELREQLALHQSHSEQLRRRCREIEEERVGEQRRAAATQQVLSAIVESLKRKNDDAQKQIDEAAHAAHVDAKRCEEKGAAASNLHQQCVQLKVELHLLLEANAALERSLAAAHAQLASAKPATSDVASAAQGTWASRMDVFDDDVADALSMRGAPSLLGQWRSVASEAKEDDIRDANLTAPQRAAHEALRLARLEERRRRLAERDRYWLQRASRVIPFEVCVSYLHGRRTPRQTTEQTVERRVEHETGGITVATLPASLRTGLLLEAEVERSSGGTEERSHSYQDLDDDDDDEVEQPPSCPVSPPNLKQNQSRGESNLATALLRLQLHELLSSMASRSATRRFGEEDMVSQTMKHPIGPDTLRDAASHSTGFASRSAVLSATRTLLRRYEYLLPPSSPGDETLRGRSKALPCGADAALVSASRLNAVLDFLSLAERTDGVTSGTFGGGFVINQGSDPTASIELSTSVGSPLRSNRQIPSTRAPALSALVRSLSDHELREVWRRRYLGTVPAFWRCYGFSETEQEKAPWHTATMSTASPSHIGPEGRWQDWFLFDLWARDTSSSSRAQTAGESGRFVDAIRTWVLAGAPAS